MEEIFLKGFIRLIDATFIFGVLRFMTWTGTLEVFDLPRLTWRQTIGVMIVISIAIPVRL